MEPRNAAYPAGMRVYVASSWRNDWQPGVVERLREDGHSVYDFRNPEPGNSGFAWSSIDPDWQQWTWEQYREALRHPLAVLKQLDPADEPDEWVDLDD